MITLLIAAALLIPPQISSTDPCPADVISLWINGGRGYGYENHVELKLHNKSDKIIELVEFQFDSYDAERRVFVSRYYLAVGCCYNAGYPGKPIGPDQTKTQWGGITSRLGLIYGGSLIDKTHVRINVIHYKDGSKWERKGWRDENPN